ncbi:unnamed protein product, partial [Meganyctiphanes norvegica]
SMFKQVFKTIFKILLFGSFLILAFSLNFTILFHTDTGDFFKNNTIYVRGFGDAILKVFVMSIGEVDYNYHKLTMLPGSASLMLLLFIFVVILVSMNLMNAIAISDLNELRKEAEFACNNRTLEYVLYYDIFRKTFLRQFIIDSSVFHCFPGKCVLITPDQFSVTWVKCNGHECSIQKYCPKFIRCPKFILRNVINVIKRTYHNINNKTNLYIDDYENKHTLCNNCREHKTDDHKCVHRHKINLHNLPLKLEQVALRHSEGNMHVKEKIEEKDLNIQILNKIELIERKMLDIEKVLKKI